MNELWSDGGGAAGFWGRGGRGGVRGFFFFFLADLFDCRARITNQIFRAMKSTT